MTMSARVLVRMPRPMTRRLQIAMQRALHPDLDLEAWVDIAGELRNGLVYNFGDNLDTTPVLSSYASSVAPLAYASSSAATPGSGGNDIRTLIREELS
ncbi:hypothetical protein Taro_045607 [Colocasia esculenta]|uniref:Uncharacterized protein n=1 Tax=Colocasia esculenta TaxID=4460 RepID=A0A843X0K4_COLES|nr:hypothetical protein [Colocasia esculenta]